MENKEENKKKYGGFLALVILVVILAFIAGISGEFFTRYYLSNFAFFRDLYFTQQNDSGNRDIIIREPKKVVVEQEMRINQIKADLQNSTAGIYEKKAATEKLLDKLFLPEDYFGQALILTSDGWLLTDSNISLSEQDNLVISYQQKIYEIEDMIKDEPSGIVFIKIQAENLPVIQLVEWTNVTAGQQVLVYNSNLDQVNLVYIKDKKYRQIDNKYDLVQSSQSLDKRILLTDGLSQEFKGSALVNFQGEIIAILDDQIKDYNQAIPLYYIQPIISQILKGEDIKRPYLGINYLNLDQISGLSAEERQEQEQGALLWPDQSQITFTSESPLVDILQPGDIIVSIEEQKIDRTNDVLDILMQYKSGQQIRIKYLQDKTEQEISVEI